MFKKLFKIFIICSMVQVPFVSNLSSEALAQSSKKKTTSKKSKPSKTATGKKAEKKKRATPSAEIRKEKSSNSELQNALNLAKNGNYEEASMRLFNLSRSPRYEKERMQIKYLLGLMLYDMKMYQTAAFHFVDVVRDGNSNYIKKSLEKLSLAADKLGDVTLLNYALSKVTLEDFPVESQDMLRFRIGEFQFRNNEVGKAAASFGAVKENSPLFAKAKYMEALCYATQNKNEMALRAYNELLQSRQDAAITDPTRVAALMGLARTHYQNKEWEQGTSYYRQVPRDTDFWHEALFEISWSQMRAAQFRSVLSNMQSLHSPYYEDFYIPESILLRSLVYLYICQYDEMGKTLDLFKKIYQPVRVSLRDLIKANYEPERYYREVEKVSDNFEKLKKDPNARKNSGVPFLVARKIMSETEFSKHHEYIKMLVAEKKMMDDLSSRWKNAAIGQYAKKVIATRIDRARESAGILAKKYIIDIHRDLLELFKQHDFARFEMLSGRKEGVKKEMMKVDSKDGSDNEEEEDRNFYIQNGHEYWPFQGEYWLDEIGNYYYLGKSRCE